MLSLTPYPRIKDLRFVVTGYPIGDDVIKKHKSVEFELKDKEIIISSDLYPDIKVTRKWDLFNSECLLFVEIHDEKDTRPYTEEQISELALEPLFFKN